MTSLCSFFSSESILLSIVSEDLDGVSGAIFLKPVDVNVVAG